MKPSVLLLGPLHLAIKVVQEAVSEQVIVGQIELTTGIVKAVAVAFTWKVEPFGVTKLIALEVEVSLATKSVSDEADHLVQAHATLNDWRELAQGRHMSVHLSITEPEEECLVTNQAGLMLAYIPRV